MQIKSQREDDLDLLVPVFSDIFSPTFFHREDFLLFSSHSNNRIISSGRERGPRWICCVAVDGERNALLCRCRRDTAGEPDEDRAWPDRAPVGSFSSSNPIASTAVVVPATARRSLASMREAWARLFVPRRMPMQLLLAVASSPTYLLHGSCDLPAARFTES